MTGWVSRIPRHNTAIIFPPRCIHQLWQNGFFITLSRLAASYSSSLVPRPKLCNQKLFAFCRLISGLLLSLIRFFATFSFYSACASQAAREIIIFGIRNLTHRLLCIFQLCHLCAAWCYKWVQSMLHSTWGFSLAVSWFLMLLLSWCLMAPGSQYWRGKDRKNDEANKSSVIAFYVHILPVYTVHTHTEEKMA